MNWVLSIWPWIVLAIGGVLLTATLFDWPTLHRSVPGKALREQFGRQGARKVWAALALGIICLAVLAESPDSGPLDDLGRLTDQITAPAFVEEYYGPWRHAQSRAGRLAKEWLAQLEAGMFAGGPAASTALTAGVKPAFEEALRTLDNAPSRPEDVRRVVYYMRELTQRNLTYIRDCASALDAGDLEKYRFLTERFLADQKSIQRHIDRFEKQE